MSGAPTNEDQHPACGFANRGSPRIALLTLSPHGLAVARAIAAKLEGCELHVHESVEDASGAKRFARIAERAAELFARCAGLVFIAPCGVAVRSVGPLLAHKTTDPAVVVVDVLGRWAISLLSGHEGGANDLAMRIANLLDAEPVITTTSEAARDVIAGVGCRRGASADSIVAAVREALAMANVAPDRLRLIASADIKAAEPGLIAAAIRLGAPLRLISSQQIRDCPRSFERSELAMRKVNLPAVAAPAALLAGRRTRLILPRQVLHSVTVALAEESCSWSASAPAGPPTAPPGRPAPSPPAT